jgi:hypothetical protein
LFLLWLGNTTLFVEFVVTAVNFQKRWLIVVHLNISVFIVLEIYLWFGQLAHAIPYLPKLMSTMFEGYLELELLEDYYPSFFPPDS